MKVLALVLAVAGGLAVGTQPLLNGALSRSRGVTEAVYVSITVSFAAIALVLAGKAARAGGVLGLPFDLRSALVLAGAAALAALALALTAHDVAPWFFGAGLLGLIVLFAGTAATPILGVGVTVALLVAGQLAAGIFWDRLGVLGLPVVPVTPQRLAGMLLVVAGVILVRGL
jgi:transporter family-2 protein